MASLGPGTPDSLVTLKVNYSGLTRRIKLPLRDMGASTLEDRLRTFLSIPLGTQCTFERYSDSAGLWVVIHPSNISVYKQLYRAAKAKSKLKIRVTTVQDEAPEPSQEASKEAVSSLSQEERKVPKPVTVEDEPESWQAASSRIEAPVLQPIETETLPVPKCEEPRVMTATYRSRPVELNEDAQKIRQDLHDCLANLVKRQQSLADTLEESLRPLSFFNGENGPLPSDIADIPVNRGPAAQQQWFNDAGRTRNQFDACPWIKESQPQIPVKDVEDQEEQAAPLAQSRQFCDFRVCCNSCEQTIPDAHYHCTKCDDDDFDLCQSCVDKGITCHGTDHWLIKRFKKNGVFISSTTETIAPKPKVAKKVEADTPIYPRRGYPLVRPVFIMRTCNCCVQELPENQFLHCTSCDDYDLCTNCFLRDAHGHHPKHGFVPAVEGSSISDLVSAKLAPGRNLRHRAICDGCDKYVCGVRHKCLDCPDWDYCGECVVNASFVHAGHRFVPIYEGLPEVFGRRDTRTIHHGICCDGPLCSSRAGASGYITGIRYKCAICNDTDFCANCEASPANTHNATHPLIKFKTPVRHVSVSTSGEHEDGKQMPQMGDRRHTRVQTNSRATETTLPPTVAGKVAMNNVQTIVDVEPSEPSVAPEEPVKAEEEIKAEVVEEPATQDKALTPSDLTAVYIRDTVTDGTVLPPNHVFEQTWVLRNAGEVEWPAGCSVKFVGGDYMGHVDSNHPAEISKLVSASESTVCYQPLSPGQEFPFTVLLRTPAREGKIISYWRLTTKDGIKFGHRLWCDVSVLSPKIKEESVPATIKTEDDASETTQSSQMIFPKLEKESPVASIHEESQPEEAEDGPSAEEEAEVDDFEECEDAEWDASEDDGFMTDEEYDILDASDEEYLEEQQKKLLKK